MHQTPGLSRADQALLALLARLDAEAYDFTPPTPRTHARVMKRRGGQLGASLREILGWSLPFDPRAAPKGLPDLLLAAGAVQPTPGGALKSQVRVSRLDGRLFLHSAWPTDAPDSVFLGPDSYRFARLIAGALPADPPGPILDLGAGAGVGAVVAQRLAPHAKVIAADINPLALRYARLNAAHAGAPLALLKSDGLKAAPRGLGAVLANPPYMADSRQAYRDGGGMMGGELSVKWARAALDHLAPGGTLILYTGVAIPEGGKDPLSAALHALAAETGAAIAYEEIDPDVFGEELERPAYRLIERIAVVSCVMTRPH